MKKEKKMSEKKKEKKKKASVGEAGWATAHFLALVTIQCIVSWHRALGRAARWPRHGQPGALHGRPARGACGLMAWPGVSRNTKIVSWLGETICVAIWRSKAAIQRCNTAAACCDMACDTAGQARDKARSARQELGHDTVFVSWPKGARDTASARCDTRATQPRYGTYARHDKA